MRLTSDKDNLEKAVQTVMRIVNHSATLESLQGILLEVIDGKLYIKATNLEVGIEVSIPTTDTEDGSVLINPKVLIDAIKYSNSKKVTLSISTKTLLKVELDNGKTNIKILNSNDFPNIIKQKDGEKIKLKVKNIINGVRSVIYAVSHSIIKPELASIYIWKDGQQLVFVATDSFRLAEKRVNQNIESIDELSILIPHKNTQDLLGVLEQVDEDEDVTVVVDKDQFSLYTDNIYITLRTIDGAFPDYQKIIPQDPITTVTVLKQDLSQIIKKAGAFSDKFNKVNLKVDTNDKKIIIKTTNGDVGETEDYIQGVVEGETSEISINHKYIVDCLQSLQSDSVILMFFGQGKPLVITGVGDKSFTYLVMPMNN
jgi:DNA polymerase-3 subunit beta